MTVLIPPDHPPDPFPTDAPRLALTTRTTVHSCKLPAGHAPSNVSAALLTLTIQARSAPALGRALGYLNDLLELDPDAELQGIRGDGWTVS